MLSAGYVDEAKAWREWLLRAVAQLDVWGEVLDGLHLARQARLAPDHDAWDLQVALLDHLESRWHEADNGLWEMHGPRRHCTHSKVMAWVAADRMIRAARDSGRPGPVDRWNALRIAIRADVLEHGYNAERGTFVHAYGSTDLDASLLLIPRVGFLPGTDPRVLGTIKAIPARAHPRGHGAALCDSIRARRTPPGEGVFIACSFWLVDALHLAGRHKDATHLFERLLDLRNDVGLLSEEWDPSSRRQLGNTPQALSHFALVVSALQLHHRRPHRSDQPIHPAH